MAMVPFTRFEKAALVPMATVLSVAVCEKPAQSPTKTLLLPVVRLAPAALPIIEFDIPMVIENPPHIATLPCPLQVNGARLALSTVTVAFCPCPP